MQVLIACLQSLALILFDAPALTSVQHKLVSSLVTQLTTQHGLKDQQALQSLLTSLKVFSDLNVPGAAEKLSELAISTTALKSEQSDNELAQALTKALPSKEFAIEMNHCAVLQGILPVDCAVFKGDKLLAVVAVQVTNDLRRIDLMKEVIYKKYYPEILFIHSRAGDVETPVLHLKDCL